MRKPTKPPYGQTRCILKKPQVIHRRLKEYQEPLLGEAYLDVFKLYIQTRQPNKEYLGTLIHEAAHCIFPDLTEYQIRKFERIMTNLIWSEGYRRMKK